MDMLAVTAPTFRASSSLVELIGRPGPRRASPARSGGAGGAGGAPGGRGARPAGGSRGGRRRGVAAVQVERVAGRVGEDRLVACSRVELRVELHAGGLEA